MKTKKMAVALFAVLMIAAAAGRGHAAEGTIKIAFVDLRRALNETSEGKKAMKKLESLKTKLQTKIAKREKAIVKMKKDLEKQQNVLTQEALKGKAEEYYKEVTELQQSYSQFQRELTSKEAKLTQDILVKMEKIIAQIGRDEGYTMIYDKSNGAVAWAPAHLDLTDKLIQLYNAQHKLKNEKKK